MFKCPACGAENPDEQKYCGNCAFSLTGDTQTGQLNPDTVLENRYVIVKTVGRGGMGAVYMALDQRLNNRSVAIKEMSTRAVGGDLQAAIGAFKKEASMLIGLEHSALPVIRDFFSKGEDRWYLVMDYIEGQTLAEIAKNRGPIPEAEVLDWARQLCEILDYLHNQQPPIVFRDLKPANIMLTPKGQIKLIDFGIARHFRAGSSADTTAYGSHGFAPPEQYGENQTSPSSDIYALGATLHYLLTGIDPGKNPFIFEPPSKYVKVSLRADTAVMKALELKAENRPKSMRDMLDLLDGKVESKPITRITGKESNTNSKKESSDKNAKDSGTKEIISPVNSNDIQTMDITVEVDSKSATNEDDSTKNMSDSKTTIIDSGQKPDIMISNANNERADFTAKSIKTRSLIIAACVAFLLFVGGAYGIRYLHMDVKPSGNKTITAKKESNTVAELAVKDNTRNESAQVQSSTATSRESGEEKSPTSYQRDTTNTTVGDASGTATKSKGANLTKERNITVSAPSQTLSRQHPLVNDAYFVVIDGDGSWARFPDASTSPGFVLDAEYYDDKHAYFTVLAVNDDPEKNTVVFSNGTIFYPNGVPDGGPVVEAYPMGIGYL